MFWRSLRVRCIKVFKRCLLRHLFEKIKNRFVSEIFGLGAGATDR